MLTASVQNMLVTIALIQRWKLHGEKFGGSARPIRRTDALNTWRAARPLFGRTAPPIWRNQYPKLDIIYYILTFSVLIKYAKA